METFSEKLIKLRKAQSLTQQELADRIGYSKSTVSSWEIGRREPDIKAILALSKIFDVKTTYLTGEDNSKIPEVEHETIWDVSELYEPICEDIKKLSLEDCFTVYDYIQSLIRMHGSDPVEKPEKTYKILHKDKG